MMLGFPMTKKRLRFQSFPYICSIDFYSFANMVTTFCFHISTICFLFFLGDVYFYRSFFGASGQHLREPGHCRGQEWRPSALFPKHGAASSITSIIYIYMYIYICMTL